MKIVTLAAGIALGFGAERLTLRRLRGVADPDTALPHLVTDAADAGRAGLSADRRHHQISTFDGGSLHAIDIGDGPVVVLLHGVTLHAGIWHHQFELADRYRVIAIDLRAHGSSTAGSDGPTIEANARDLAMILEKLDLHDVVIAGHSMGGMVLGRFLVDHPDVVAERVGAVGFIASAGRNPARVPTGILGPVAEQLRKLALARPKLAKRIAQVPPSDLGEIAVRATFGDTPHPDAVRETALAFEALPPADLLAIAPSIFDHDVLDELRSVNTPASIIVGSDDPLTEVAESKRLASAMPHAAFTILPDAGHQLMLERPDEINEFLSDLVEVAKHARPIE